MLYDALEFALEKYTSTHKALFIDWWQLLEAKDIAALFGDHFPGWEAEHASLLETSPMEELAPELVRSELKADGGAARFPSYEIFPLPEDIVAATGVGWTAAPASRELGSRVADLLVDRIVEIVEMEFPDHDGSGPRGKPPQRRKGSNGR